MSCIFLSACASHSYLNSPGHGAFLHGDYEAAGDLFAKEITQSNNNKLLFQLDAGMSYFDAGHFDQAIPFFLQAVKFWEEKDYTSITESAAKYAISENLKTYIGEDYERVLIHVFLALSYAGVGKIEDAQVEAIRIDLLLKKMRDEEKKNYTESAFARYLSAVLWEATGEYDSARIDFEAAYKIDPNLPGIRQDLLRASKESNYEEEYQRWKKQFPGEAAPKIDPHKSELIVFVTYGLGPIKVPHSDDSTALPQLFPRPWTKASIEVSLGALKNRQSKKVLDIEDLNKKFFDEKLKWLAARKVITLGIKAGAAYVVAKTSKNEALGWLTFIALAAMDTADLRGWNTLPAGVDIMRMPVDAGYHDVSVQVKSANGTVLRDLKMGQRQFIRGKKLFVVLHEG